VFDQVTSITDPLGNPPTQYGYDNFGNLTSITDPLNRTSTFTYNSLGQLTSATTPTPLNETTTYGYWPITADLKTITDPLHNVTTFTTDTLGRVVQISTPMGHVANYVHDALDHITAATDGNGNTTSYTYDLLGLPLSVSDAKGNTTKITRPWTLNKETACDMQSPPKCTVTNFNYAGNKTDYVNKLGIKTVVTYDGLQRPQLANVNTTNAPYDTHHLSFAYDGLDRPLSIEDQPGNSTTVTTTSLTNTILYQYDGSDNVVSERVKTPDSGINVDTTVAYQYDGDSRLTQKTISGTGSGQSYGYAYNAGSELTGITGGALAAALTYDTDGHRKTLTTGAVVTTYGYDADSQLTSLSFNNSLGQIGYNYDSDGRVTSESGSLASLNLPQTEGPNSYSVINQITNWGGATVTSDSAGNLTSDASGQSFAWDSRNQLTSISGPPVTSFMAAYDAVMRRFNQTTAFGGTTTYLHDKNVVEQSTTSGGPSNPLNNYLTMPGTGEVLAFTTTGGTYVPLHDRLGSTIGLVNSSNSLQTQYTYEPFGNVTTTGSASSYPFLFGGMELDLSGLYHTQTRYYSPTFGRFLSADAGLAPNLFTYADNDPVNATDPSGRSPEYASDGSNMSSPMSSDVLLQTTNPRSGDAGLGGTLLAQEEGGPGCGDGAGDCSIDVRINPN
jgi:RHS repeat-associated protein